MIALLLFLLITWLICVNARRRGGTVWLNLIHGTFILLLYSAFFSIVECVWYLRLLSRSELIEAWLYITLGAADHQVVIATIRAIGWGADLVSICLAGALIARRTEARWSAVALSVPFLCIYALRASLTYSAWVDSYAMPNVLRGFLLYIVAFGWLYILAAWFYWSDWSSGLFPGRIGPSGP